MASRWGDLSSSDEESLNTFSSCGESEEWDDQQNIEEVQDMTEEKEVDNVGIAENISDINLFHPCVNVDLLSLLGEAEPSDISYMKEEEYTHSCYLNDKHKKNYYSTGYLGGEKFIT